MLGESPLWHQTDEVFYWVDIVGRVVYRYVPAHDSVESVLSGEMVTALSESASGGLVLVTPEALLSMDDGEVSILERLELPERVRTNDGKCDPSGRLWFGTMDYETSDPIAELFVYDGDRVKTVETGIVLSNGLGWNPDNDVMYHVDSIRRHIYAYRYDDSTGAVRDRKVLADMGELPGLPDGLSVDVDGNLWVAIYDGWCLRVVDAGGRVIHQEKLPVQKPTSVAFGGAERSVLYVTSASQELAPDELKDQPASGSVFRFDPGTTGMAPGTFGS